MDMATQQQRQEGHAAATEEACARRFRPEESEEEEEDGDDDCFFESLDRVPSGISIDLDFDAASSGSDGEDDVRVSFASAVGPPSNFRRRALGPSDEDEDEDDEEEDDEEEERGYDFGIWMAEPISIQERRRLLLQGMGLASGKDLQTRGAAGGLRPSISRHLSRAPTAAERTQALAQAPPSPSLLPVFLPVVLTRSRSDTQAAGAALTLRPRASSAPPSLGARGAEKLATAAPEAEAEAGADDMFTIKNLDTGKEFVVSEVGKDGTWGRLNDLQTGLQLTLDEFERFLGYSPIVKELMRRVNLGGGGGSAASAAAADGRRKARTSSELAKSSGRKKGSWLRNIKVVASSMTGLITTTERDKDKEKEKEKEKERDGPSEWMKVHQHGKSCKELTGLYMCQEIQAHQGSIWSIKFSSDSRYLASAGEDRIVHVWQVLQCDAFSRDSGQIPPTPATAPNDNLLLPSKRRTRKGKALLGTNSSSRHPLPDYIVVPDTIFSLSDKPVCSFQGHLDDVLDLSWSKYQNLLSSSMDKTVRLWDMESKACLKLFAHNDYVTCIQFNPIDDRYFISGSLDAKVRIWSIPDRQVVDWSDLHEMVTAARYTPDGQGAIVGSHKGSCRFFRTSDNKLYQEGKIDIRNKRRKSHAKKITGFQFAPGNPSEVMITAADSQIRVFDGVNMIHKYRGFRNTSSQISASFTSDGKYVVCASEDSHVYIWKRDVLARSSSTGGKGKSWVTSRSHEHFHCRDVSVAIPWPNCGGNCEETSLPSWSGRHGIFSDDSLWCSADSLRCSSTHEGASQSSRSHCPPPLPGKNNSELMPSSEEHPRPPPSRSRRVQSSSFASASPSMRSGPLSSLAASTASSSSLLSWGWHGGGSNRSSCGNIEDASAWGLVVVTASLGGNIRIYQNFGLPIRLSRQTNLF